VAADQVDSDFCQPRRKGQRKGQRKGKSEHFECVFARLLKKRGAGGATALPTFLMVFDVSAHRVRVPHLSLGAFSLGAFRWQVARCRWLRNHPANHHDHGLRL